MKVVLIIFRFYKPIIIILLKLFIWYITLSFFTLFFMFTRGKWFLSKMKSYRIGISDFWNKLEQKYFLKSGFCPFCFSHVLLLKSKILGIDECVAKGLKYGQTGSYTRKALIASHYIDKTPVYRNAKIEYSISWNQENYNCQSCSRDFELIFSVTSRSYDDLYRK